MKQDIPSQPEIDVSLASPTLESEPSGAFSTIAIAVVMIVVLVGYLYFKGYLTSWSSEFRQFRDESSQNVDI